MKKLFLFAFSLMGGLILVPLAASAQSSIGIAISPLVFEITGNPGETITNQIKITNNSQNTTEITMSVEDIAPSDEEGHVVVEPADTQSYSASQWISTSPSKFTLDPGGSQWVSFSITLPSNAEPGGHYASIVAAGTVVAGGGGSGTAILPRVGALALITVPGDVTEKLTVTNFSAPHYSEYGPISFTVAFQNEGNIHEKPNALITVTNWLGQKIAAIPLPQNNVLPTATRKFTASLPQKWLWAGKYTATVTGSYGINNYQIAPVVITFWAFPWKFGLVILVILILLFLARKRFVTAFKILVIGDKKKR